MCLERKGFLFKTKVSPITAHQVKFRCWGGRCGREGITQTSEAPVASQPAFAEIVRRERPQVYMSVYHLPSVMPELGRELFKAHTGGSAVLLLWHSLPASRFFPYWVWNRHKLASCSCKFKDLYLPPHLVTDGE